MTKRLLFCVLIALVLGQSVGQAQTNETAAAFSKGSKNLNFEGSLDFEHEDELLFNLSVGFGYFPINRVMAKVYVDRTDFGSESSATGLGVGAYYFHPLTGIVYGFAGARAGWQYYDYDDGSADSLYLSPRLGVEALITPTVGLYLQYYYTLQDENVYQNDSGELDDQDSGLYSGLMIFF